MLSKRSFKLNKRAVMYKQTGRFDHKPYELNSIIINQSTNDIVRFVYLKDKGFRRFKK